MHSPLSSIPPQGYARVRVRSALRSLAAALSIALLVGCGGGGGGGGGTPANKPGGSNVKFEGVFFRSPSGALVATAPIEAPDASPPTLGAPLNQTIVFRFSGKPEGPFNASTMPVFTTPELADPTLGVPASLPIVLAKGSYVAVDNLVEFRPFVPTAPLQLSLAAPPAAVPGLLPGSSYIARVSAAPQIQIPNLEGPGGEVTFSTTSNPASFFPTGTVDPAPPRVVASVPENGAIHVNPKPFNDTALDTGEPLVPAGPKDFQLSYDHPLRPTVSNLSGKDIDGDGLREPNFFASVRATPILVGHAVPAGALGAHESFAALSGLREGTSPDAMGGDLIVHAGPSDLPTGTHEAELPGVPSSLAVGAEPGLAFAVFERPGASDLFGVFGPVLGDASFARLGVTGEAQAPALFDTGLDRLRGLTLLRSGRLLAYDATSRRVHELRPVAKLQHGTPEAPGPSAPHFTALQVGDGSTNGFRSEPLDNPLLSAPLDVLDLAVAPSGRLTALARLSPGAFPSLVRLSPIDRGGKGEFADDGAQFLAEPGDVLATFAADYIDVVFLSETELLALDPANDRIDFIDLSSGSVSLAVPGVAGFGSAPSQLPGGTSSARCLSVGELQLELLPTLLDNESAGAEVSLRPRALLPLGAELRVMQRNTLESLTGHSEFGSSLHADTTAFGANEILRVHTALPSVGADAPLADSFHEEFESKALKSPQVVGPYPEAEWAEVLGAGGVASGFLRAARGVSDLHELGDFTPAPNPNYDAGEAYEHNDNDGEDVVNTAGGHFRTMLLNTTAQNFPLPDGSTPGVTSPTTITDGVFIFRDIIIPAGVRVLVLGDKPITMIATGTVRIDGMIDVSGVDGYSDDSFNSGFLPVRGGPGGPGAGRGGDGHPTLFDPSGPGSIDQYVTPETGERGYGPRIKPNGQRVIEQIGGHGGTSTLGYTPPFDMPESYTDVNDSGNTEHSRPPGGGGGSMALLGQSSRDGSGAYRVQSNSTYFPFDKCPTNDNIHDATYGNEENLAIGAGISTPLQCVYFVGDFPEPDAVVAGAEPGDAVFADGDPDNDFFGPGGEYVQLLGGQGGGGGGSRVDSFDHELWSLDKIGSPTIAGPPFYPTLQVGPRTSPTLIDAKGAGGGGGGGAIMIRSFGDIVIGDTAYIDASGGHGGGGEGVRNSSFVGGGGGGSGGAIVLQAAGAIEIRGDAGHTNAGFVDADGDIGAALDVSGGFGRDARTAPTNTGSLSPFTYDYTRSDGGAGSFGLIQLQSGANQGQPIIDAGAFLFARQRAVLKLGNWTGDQFHQGEHFSFVPGSAFNPPDALRYIDMLHYRYFRTDGPFGPRTRNYVLNGSFPPIIPSTTGDNGQGFVNQWPEGDGAFWADTRMIENPDEPGRWVVEEPQPEKVMKTYNGYDDDFKEQNNPGSDPEFPFSPGDTYKFDRLPFNQFVEEPSGKPLFIEVDGEQRLDPDNILPKLPVVPLHLASPVISPRTTGTSAWLEFGGIGLRPRDALGRTPPFFEPVHGTYNPAMGPVPAGMDGHVVLAGTVPLQPARYVAKAGSYPIDPGLFGKASDPPYNDLSVDSLDLPFPELDALSDNASVRLHFQGARTVRTGSNVPDLDTLTDWVSDLTLLDGYPLVRFQVSFDVAVDPVTYPFDETSYRPQVGRVRMRMSY
ncbi:MAG: hypothetical protein DHS20C15_11450 [Planctomycetota bacterium]|nr:MAG: hypothetical protein DHS20C15_11450 [Planctomycetota bacterium]